MHQASRRQRRRPATTALLAAVFIASASCDRSPLPVPPPPPGPHEAELPYDLVTIEIPGCPTKLPPFRDYYDGRLVELLLTRFRPSDLCRLATALEVALDVPPGDPESGWPRVRSLYILSQWLPQRGGAVVIHLFADIPDRELLPGVRADHDAAIDLVQTPRDLRTVLTGVPRARRPPLWPQVRAHVQDEGRASGCGIVSKT
jgi:hypothetical protein